MIRVLLTALALSALMPVQGAAAPYFEGRRYAIVTDAVFTADPFIIDQARFWWEIYVNVSEDEGLIHDPFHPEVIFRKVRVPANGGRAGARAAEAAVNAIREELRSAVAKDSASRTPSELELMGRFPEPWDSTAVTLCADRLRFQRGLKNKFRSGLERSYRYLPLIDSIFAERGLPSRLKYLPHVESSFYPHAYSKVGAAGMWQFMKSSARHFKMKVGYQLDERRDPQASTEAAAGLLGYNYRLLKNWPLAVVAYNHGPGGMSRAAKGTGSNDLTTIIKSYYSNSFGFASKNFYAEFLASSSIALQADSLYPGLNKMEPLRFQRVVLPKAMGTRLVCTVTGLSAAELEEYNLGLRPATFRSNAQLPKGTILNLPITLDAVALSGRLGGAVLAAAAVPAAGSVASAKSAVGASAAAPVQTALAAPDADASAAPADKSGAGPAAEPPASAVAAAATASPQPTPSASTPASAPSAAQEKKARKGKGKDKGAPETAVAMATPELRSAEPPPASVPAGPEAGKAPKPFAPGAQAAAPPLRSAQDTSPMAAMKAAEPAAVPAPVASAPHPEPQVVDSNFALQASDLDKLAHPMDRFNPAIYNLQYEYAKGDLTIRVGTEETLSHYAEWAWVPEKSLRLRNRVRSARDLSLGRPIRIPMAEEKVKEFVSKREEYYRAMEEDFYSNYYVSATEPLVVAKGMNLWSWSYEKEIPFWLLQKHNPGKALSEVRPGDTLSVPMIETGIRKWGFTRYGNSREYLAGITRAMLSPQ